MTSMKIFVTALAMCAIISIACGEVQQARPHQNQGRIRRQAAHEEAIVDLGEDQNQEAEGAEDEDRSRPVWTTCDYNPVGSRISCADCNTRLICKPGGGLLKNCTNPFRPHCNNGICSPVPSVECAEA